MNNTLRILLFSLFGIGNILLLISRKLKDQFTDFELGFLEGLSVVCILTGAVYLTWCAFKKQNPIKQRVKS
ncbi:hypothetical protein QUH73_14000 [Labilibaculum sp. K2S]|uniref:hypothetical protein n=1 Tax=Labilibaculum sp. K2S TaxID=3056386 RepID=UPI0025A495FA|nr:hypothetical protein [Labilibaculum sp. K2S]MDM8160933.1 hypothetical protein [Labilibaculum sp. K2S]